MITVKAENDFDRLDSFVASLSWCSRTEAARLIGEGKILLNGRETVKKHPVLTGDEVTRVEEEARPYEVEAENIPLDIVYQDADMAVINKARGMVVHPAHGNLSGTLVHAALYHFHDLSGINGVLRPGIVHRLDKDTSGLICLAKNDFAHEALAKQFKERSCEKDYLALVAGTFSSEKFSVEGYIGRSRNDRKKMALYAREEDGKFSSTDFTVLEQYRDAALVSCRLNTGRTHQIRLHLASCGHPCLGDTVYGAHRDRFGFSGQALHSHRLFLTHPRTGERMTFTAPLPEDMELLRQKLKNG